MAKKTKSKKGATQKKAKPKMPAQKNVASRKGRRGAPTKPNTIARVVQGKWTAKQLAAITFLANPRGGTHVELSRKIKVARTTISEWKKLDGFMEDVHRVAAVYFLEADLQVDRANLRDAIKDPTKHPDVAGSIIKARELYYKRRGLLVDVHEHTGDVTFRWAGGSGDDG